MSKAIFVFPIFMQLNNDVVVWVAAEETMVAAKRSVEDVSNMYAGQTKKVWIGGR